MLIYKGWGTLAQRIGDNVSIITDANLRGSSPDPLTERSPTVIETLDLATRNNRVCPIPKQWNVLYQLLPGKRRVGNGWEPSLPLILAAWADTPALWKMLRLREHIEWAADHNALAQVHTFLASLSESEWHHIGE
jgi:hypothetical protein